MILKCVAPLFVVLGAILSEYTGLDEYLARLVYDPATQSWPWKNNFWTAGVLHNFGKDLVVYIMAAIFLFFIASFFIKKIRPFRKGAFFMIAGGLSGVAIVSLLKNTTHIYTPWDLSIFGGDRPHVLLFDSAPKGLPVGYAFPGGHSSGGFSFLTLYFLLEYYKPKYKYYGLLVGLGLGGLFAMAQELRGAHFLSHDLFSMVICWYSAMAIFELMYHKEKKEGRKKVPAEG